MRIEPSGIVMIGECEIQTPCCTALTPAPITAVWGSPGRRQIDVCRGCLEQMIRLGEWENPGARITRSYDIAVYDKKERLQLVVEVKTRPYELATQMEDWATRIRRNLILHSGIPSSVYFMLAVFPAPFYFWDQKDAPEALPRYTFDASSEVMACLHDTIDNKYRQQEEAVTLWLRAIVNGTPGIKISTEEIKWLFRSGLHQAIQGGTVVTQAKANGSERQVLQAA